MCSYSNYGDCGITLSHLTILSRMGGWVGVLGKWLFIMGGFGMVGEGKIGRMANS